MKKLKLPFDILDSIRGIAAFYVTIAHCRGSLWMGGNEFMKQLKSSFKAIQYITLGKPTIATAIGTNFRVIENGESGFLIKSEEEWINTILQLAKVASLNDKWGKMPKIK